MACNCMGCPHRTNCRCRCSECNPPVKLEARQLDFISGWAPTGWKCPGCGRCFSPTTTECPHCSEVSSKCVHDFDTTITVPRCKNCGVSQFVEHTMHWTTMEEK